MRLTFMAVLALLLVACDPRGELAATPTPTPPEPLAIEHLRGSTDVVLRFELTGGFVLPEYLAIQAPTFTLYGDGGVIFRNPTKDPPPTVDGDTVARPFQYAILTEDQVQAVLADALGRGGLGVARADYPGQVMDLPTAVFTINAGGLNKKVSVNGLGFDVGSSPDGPALTAFAELAARLEDFDHGGTLLAPRWSPGQYRGTLLAGDAGEPFKRTWPWETIAPADFVTDPDPNGFPLPARVLSSEEVRAVELKVAFNGGSRVTLIGPDRKTYLLVLRPLLPDEAK